MLVHGIICVAISIILTYSPDPSPRTLCLMTYIASGETYLGLICLIPGIYLWHHTRQHNAKAAHLLQNSESPWLELEKDEFLDDMILEKHELSPLKLRYDNYLRKI